MTTFVEENINCLFLSKKYFNNTVLDELNLENPKFLDDIISDKIYMIRIWIRWSNSYVYKIGTTTNIKRRFKEINYEYDCCGRIIIVACGIVSSNTFEKEIHNNLKMYRVNNITNPIKSNKKELYQINNDLYDKFIDLLKIYSNNIFESNDYVIDNNNIEHLRCYDEYKKYFSDNMIRIINNNDNFILLNKDFYELEYWTFITKEY
jgi:hypothetical protein